MTTYRYQALAPETLREIWMDFKQRCFEENAETEIVSYW